LPEIGPGVMWDRQQIERRLKRGRRPNRGPAIIDFQRAPTLEHLERPQELTDRKMIGVGVTYED
jgi:hypothetical protein